MKAKRDFLMVLDILDQEGTNTQQIFSLQTTLTSLLENWGLTFLGRSDEGEERFFKVWDIFDQEHHSNEILGRLLATHIVFERTIPVFPSYIQATVAEIFGSSSNFSCIEMSQI
jgi:hypothetical protein